MKSKVALLVLSALALASTAHAAEVFNKDGNKLDLNGRVKGAHEWTRHANADKTDARLGIKGTTQITDGLTGYGQYQVQFDASNAEGKQSTPKTRLAFAGLNIDNVATIDYGRNYGVGYDVEAYTDVGSEYTGDAYSDTDRQLTGRASGVLTARTANLFGLADGVNVAAQYQGTGRESENKVTRVTHGPAYGFSLGYDNIADSGASVISTYTTGENASGIHSELWAAGAKFEANGFYVASIYGESRNLIADGHKAQHLSSAVAYTFDNGLRPNVTYTQTKVDKDAKSSLSNKDVALGLDYNLNKNLVLDVAYRLDLDTHNDNAVLTAITYQF
ncbi:porin [Salmonella enterica]|nr:porin [Salmonella enterica subsp. enterica serovar Saintpaul]EEC1303363.1 porin [Salmonella enterica]